MHQQELIPHLFRTEYSKMVAVLCSLFGLQHIEIAEDIVSDTFLSATELWGLKGLPENPVAWLYTVAKNKTRNYLRRDAAFHQKIAPELQYSRTLSEDIEIDLSDENIKDSQLAMMFAVCDPVIPKEAQVALALNLLCGFGIQEIADAFLTNKEVIYKRIQRAKGKLKQENVKIQKPSGNEIIERLDTVLAQLYLLFNEGYYSASQNLKLRRDFCWEAMRLNYLLTTYTVTNLPAVNALLSLMCFQASRFDARLSEQGEIILYEDQDINLWDEELISKGRQYLRIAFMHKSISKYLLEAAIANCHTQKEDTFEKWDAVLQFYNQLLMIEYSPVAALNRTYALSKVHGNEKAIKEAERLQLTGNHFYHTLLGRLYTGVDVVKALQHFRTALSLVHAEAEKKLITGYINRITGD